MVARARFVVDSSDDRRHRGSGVRDAAADRHLAAEHGIPRDLQLASWLLRPLSDREAPGADRDWLLRRQVPHPFGPYRDPLDFDLARWLALRRSFIDCTQPAFPTIAPSRLRVRELPGFALRELRTGHCPMVSAAPELAQLLIELAQA